MSPPVQHAPDNLAVILDHVGDSVTVQDPSGRLVCANAAATEALGFASAAELLAAPIAEVVGRFALFDEAGQPFPLENLPGRRALQGEPENAPGCVWRLFCDSYLTRPRWPSGTLKGFAMSRLLLVLAFLVLAGVNPLRAAAQATPEAMPAMIETTEFGPVPADALGPAIPSEGYLVEEIAGGLYWVTEGSYQAMFLTTGEGVILVDAPPSIGANLAAAIASVTDEPVTHLVYTHHHADHIGGAAQFADATIVAQEETAALLERSNDPNRPLPTVTFADTYTLTVGSQTLQLDYHGNNHEPGNIFVYAPDQKILMVVDIVFPGWAPFADLAIAEDVPGFVAAHDTILTYDFETFIGGHLTRLGTREDVETSQAYVLDIRTNAADALATVDFGAIAQAVGFENPWALFDAYLTEVAETCGEATVPVWQDRLGGTDVFTEGHCWAMAESLRID